MDDERLLEIRSLLDRPLSENALTCDPKTEEWWGFAGGSWKNADSTIRVYLPSAVVLDFRGRNNRPDPGKLFLHQGTISFGSTHINVCVSLETREQQEKPGVLSLLSGDSRRIYHHCIARIEQVNFGYIGYQAIGGLDDKHAQLAGLAREAARDLLDRAQLHAARDKRNLVVSGELLEHWEDPRPEILEFHHHVRDRILTLGRNGLTRIPEDRFSFEKKVISDIATIRDEPGISINLPYTDREDPAFHQASVTVHGVRVPIGVQKLGATSLDGVLGQPRGSTQCSLYLHAIIHPLSPRVRVLHEHMRPKGIDPETVSTAVRLMNDAWLAWPRQRSDRSIVETIIL